MRILQTMAIVKSYTWKFGKYKKRSTVHFSLSRLFPVNILTASTATETYTVDFLSHSQLYSIRANPYRADAFSSRESLPTRSICQLGPWQEIKVSADNCGRPAITIIYIGRLTWYRRLPIHYEIAIDSIEWMTRWAIGLVLVHRKICWGENILCPFVY